MAKPSDPVPDTALYATGAIQSRGFTLDGQMHGVWEFFRKDGSVMRSGEFSRGRQVGIWRTFDPDVELSLIEAIEEQALPTLRAMTTLDDFLAFVSQHYFRHQVRFQRSCSVAGRACWLTR